MGIRIGVDTGGTFTDLVAADEQTGALSTLKTPSTPEDPGRAILAGLEQGQAQGLWHLADVSMVVHGTTVATNTLLERRGAKTALITTRGFRDVLAIQRQNRPALYDLRSRRPEPLVPRSLRFELTERVLADGSIETLVDADDLQRIVAALKQEAPQAVVVGLLHSYTNPEHEIQVANALKRSLPDTAISLSHQIAPEQGEFERLSTAAANGYVQPVVESYLTRLESGLRSLGVAAPLFVMKSSGGAATATTVAQRCIETALSGPAGGVRACVELAKQTPSGNLIAADMGGTSFDVAVISNGRPQLAREASIGELPLRIPMLDIHTVGAGGGSLAWVDAGGALRVGPESAGAQPGPACYSRGGTRPTVTDANLVLGRLAPASRLAGGTALDLAAATKAIEQHLAEPLSLSIEQAASGILQVANAAMVAALRTLTVERGIDPRDYALCPFGGAGPLHGAELAEQLGMTRVIVPATPGVFSANGLLNADLREDQFAPLQLPLDAAATHELAATAELLRQRACDALQVADQEASTAIRVARCAAAMRYVGQSGELQVEWQFGKSPELQPLADGLHAAHRQRFGFDRPDHTIELVGVAVSVERVLPRLPASEKSKRQAMPETTRDVGFAAGHLATRIVDRQALTTEEPLVGPAIVEQDDTTIVVPPEWAATTDAWGTLTLSK